MSLKGYKAFITMIILVLAAAFLAACDTTDTSDYYGPRILNTSPESGATNTPTGASISVQFSETVQADSITTASFLVRELDGSLANISGTISVGLNTAVFVPDSALAPLTTYLVTLLSSITDEHLNYMSTSYTWFFTTGLSTDAFDTFSTAVTVLGQLDFTGSAAGASAAALNAPGPGPFVYNGMLYVPDAANNRVLGYMNVPAVNNAPADFVLGQLDLVSAGAGNSPTELRAPSSVYVDADRTYVIDGGNNRVLIWNSVAVTNAPIANIAVGQPDLDENSAGCSAAMLNGPSAVWAAGGRLIVSDTQNNRVLVWNSIPAVSNTAADVVLGQGLMNSCAARTPVGADTLNLPSGVWSDGARLVVADYMNNRVLIWKNFPAVSNTPADIVLGQPDMTGSASYVSALDMKGPAGVSVSPDNMLYVVDSGNSRVMAWNRVPSSSYTPADAVLGQAAFYWSACNDSNMDGMPDSPGASTLCDPSGVHAYGVGNLVVSDTGNNRALIYNAP